MMLTDVCQCDICLCPTSDVCLSHTSGLSREQEDQNWHRGSPRHTRLRHHFQYQKVKGVVHRGRGHIVAASRLQLVSLHWTIAP